MDCATLIAAATPALGAGQTVAEAVAALAESGLEALPVTDGAGRYVGLFGLADFFALVVPRVALAGDMRANLRFVADDPSDLAVRYRGVKTVTVGERCDRGATALYPDTPAIEAFRLFIRGHRVLPVIAREDGKLLGLISSADAIRAIISP